MNMPGSTLPVTFLGASLMLLVPLLAGGVWLRMLSASRALLLRPHARGRLLAGALGILALVTMLWMACYWMAFLSAPEQFRPDTADYVLMYALTLSFGTQCAIALFIASRSPLWTLIVLVLWQAPALLLQAFGVEDTARLIGGPVSLGISIAAWLVFGFWFLRARRIHASAWQRGNAGTDAQAVISAAPIESRAAALSRWVLANNTPLGIGLQCLIASLGLLALQWMLSQEVGGNALQAAMFGALSAVTLVIGAIGRSMARRSRALWLSAGYTRLELFEWMERRLLSVAAAVCAAVALSALLAWVFLTPRSTLPLSYLLAAILLPGVCAGWLGLMQQHQRSIFDTLAIIPIAAGIFSGLVVPVYVDDAAPRWVVLAGEFALAVLLRTVAYRRWRGADWRRANSNRASGGAS
jgi:hypothetical protein